MTFKALLAAKTGEKISTSVVEMNEHDLMPGDVAIAVDYSTVNYKDALAITGPADVIRQFPLIPGIDLAGARSGPVDQHPERLSTTPTGEGTEAHGHESGTGSAGAALPGGEDRGARSPCRPSARGFGR